MSGTGQKDVIYLNVDGLERRYVLYRPDSVVLSGEMVPAVIMLDGRGGTPWTAMKSTGWNVKADAEGFIAVYPEATRLDPEGPLHFLTNPQMWNAGGTTSDAQRPEVDDLTFLKDVIADLCDRARVDPARIYMTGFSNGAAMTYRYALTHPGTLAAIGPVAGRLVQQDPSLELPVPCIAFSGKLDPLTPYEGGVVELPWGKVEERPAVTDSIHVWAELCGHDATAGLWSSNDRMSCLRYGEEGARDEVVFFGVHDLGHVWPGGHRLLPEKLVGASSDAVSATDRMWAFFLNHRKNAD